MRDMEAAMSYNKKTRLCIELCILIFGIVGCAGKNETTEPPVANRIQLVEQTIEYGEEFPDDIRDYVIADDKNWYEDAKLDLYGVNRDELGTYAVYIKHGDQRYETTITIQDTLPPTLTLQKEYEAYTNTIVFVEDLVQAEDPSGVKYVRVLADDNERIYETEPGVKEYRIKACDMHSNTVDVTICINFMDGYDQMTTVTNDKGWILAYHEMIRDYEKEKMERDSSSPMTYSLVYLNDDEIPELVIGNTGYWVSVYTWYYGKTVAVIEGWNYGAFGIGGYYYLPREGVVYFSDADFAGYIRSYYYLQINEKLELTSCNDKSLSIWMFRDEDEDYYIDEGEEVEEPIFYYGDTEISEEEFQTYCIEGDYEMLIGEKYAREILDEMIEMVEE